MASFGDGPNNGRYERDDEFPSPHRSASTHQNLAKCGDGGLRGFHVHGADRVRLATFRPGSAAYVWMVFCVLLSFVVGLLLLARSRYPHATFVAACVAVLVFPYDSTIALMALTALLARRNDTRTTVRAIAAGGFVTLVAQVRDTLRPPEASIWHMVFAKPDTGSQYGTDLVMLADERTIVVTAVVAALLELAIATLAGLHIRSRALASLATAKADAADAQVAQLKTAIDSQQLADAIAAEAHDTLAHSLSLLALNASALQAESKRLVAEAESMDAHQLAEQTGRIAEKTEEIRKQAAGALDEAHSVIDMLRHPEQAREQLAPSDETSLTRESLDALIGDARAAGMRLNTWIDIQQLGQLNRETGKIAYRSLQEGLTNASRHAPGSPVLVGNSPPIPPQACTRMCPIRPFQPTVRISTRMQKTCLGLAPIARTGGTRPPVRRNMPIRF